MGVRIASLSTGSRQTDPALPRIHLARRAEVNHVQGAKGGLSLDFSLPQALEAGEPPEARGLQRDQVRLMVSHLEAQCLEHTRFQHLPDLLDPGDLLVVNTSGTMNAALIANRGDGRQFELHLSTQLPAGLWIVELRLRSPEGTEPFYDARPDETLALPGGGQAILHTPYREDQRQAKGNNPPRSSRTRSSGRNPLQNRVRLWIATLHLPSVLEVYLEQYGFPIRYKYVREAWPISYYQTIFAEEMGSAEMPSAGRAFTPELLSRLGQRGVHIAPLVLHTGVASLEDHEPPYEEYFRVPPETAQAVKATQAARKRVIAVGTTVVRALETVTGDDGKVHPGEGWTSLVITPERGLRAVNSLLTGLHEPRSTHLGMLQALTGLEPLCRAYQEALKEGYLWHEFGDLHLILP